MTPMWTVVLAAAAVLLPFLAGLVGILFGRRTPGGPGAIAVLGTASASVLAIVVLSTLGEPELVRESAALLAPTGSIPITVGVRVDGLSATVAPMVTLVALAVQVYSIGYLRGDRRYSSYAALVSLFTAAMLTVVLAADLIMLYVGWEIMGICSYLLIGHHWEERRNSAAAVKAFLMTRLGDVGFLFGIFVLGVAADSFRVSDVLDAVPTMSPGALTAGTLLLIVGVVGKAAQFPLHSWLPDAMAGPAPVSALIHAATMVAAGAYLVARLYPAFVAAPLSLAVLGVIAAISMLGAALAALGSDDLKRVLAYSTISQVALMLGALAVGGRLAGVAHLLSHAAFKALLFLCAGAVITAVGGNLMSRMGGLRRSMPITFPTMTVGLAALAGLPPTSGFFSKDAIIVAAEEDHTAVGRIVLAAILITTAVTAGYATRTWLRTFFGPARHEKTEIHEAPAVLTAPLVALAVPALLLGFAGLGISELRPHLFAALISVALSLFGALLAYLSWRRDPARAARPVLATAFHTDDLYERTVAPVTRRLARGVVGVDDRVVGRAVTGTGLGARRLGGVLRLTQNGNAQSYLTGVLAGVLVLAVGVVVLR